MWWVRLRQRGSETNRITCQPSVTLSFNQAEGTPRRFFASTRAPLSSTSTASLSRFNLGPCGSGSFTGLPSWYSLIETGGTIESEPVQWAFIRPQSDAILVSAVIAVARSSKEDVSSLALFPVGNLST